MSNVFKKIGLGALGAVIFLMAAALLLQGGNFAVLNPEGIIASKQRDLIIWTTLLGMLVVVPVFVLTFVIAWRYREGNKKAKYDPNWDHNKKLEFTWWAIPFALISVLSVITWFSSHALDPYKPLASDVKPLRVQVVALQWKWLFIYPDYDIATVNFVQFPEDVPVEFTITADAPMNSFWIPQLGGQVYAMSGMSTKLHLMADKPGSYDGSSANLSGEGFAGMKFIAKSSTQADFDDWVMSARTSSLFLGDNEYKKLAQPDKNPEPASYSGVEPELYDKIVNKFMLPHNQDALSGTPAPEGHNHSHDADHSHGGGH